MSRRSPSVVKVEVNGWTTLENRDRSSPESLEDELSQPYLKRKADKSAKSPRPSKVARLSEDDRISRNPTRSFLPVTSGALTGQSQHLSSISQTHMSDSRDTAIPSPTQGSSSSGKKHANHLDTRSALSVKGAGLNAEALSINSDKASVAHLPPAQGKKHPSYLSEPWSRLVPKISSQPSDKQKRKRPDDWSSSDSLPDPAELLDEIIRLPKANSKVDGQGSKNPETDLHRSSRAKEDEVVHVISSDSEVEEQLVRKKKTSMNSTNVVRKASKTPAIADTAGSDGVIDLTLDDEDIASSLTLARKERGTTFKKVSSSILSRSGPSLFKISRNQTEEGSSVFSKPQAKNGGRKSVSHPSGVGKASNRSALAAAKTFLKSSSEVIDLCSDSDEAKDPLATSSDFDLLHTKTVSEAHGSTSRICREHNTSIASVPFMAHAKAAPDASVMPLPSTINEHVLAKDRPDSQASLLSHSKMLEHTKVFNSVEPSVSLNGAHSHVRTTDEYVLSDSQQQVPPASLPVDAHSTRASTPMDYVEWSVENLPNSTTDLDNFITTNAPAVTNGSKAQRSPTSSSSLTNSVPPSFSSAIPGSPSESSGLSLQQARKSTLATRINQRQDSQNEDDSSPCGTPEPEKPATASTPSGRRIVAIKEPDYAKLREDISESFPNENNELSAAIRWPAEEVSTLLHDMINRLPEGYLFNPYMKHIFESMIEENTALDEPTAPPIQIVGVKNGPVTPPWEFYYTNKIMHGRGVPRSDKKLLKGCDCIGPCDPKSKTCACAVRQMAWTGEDKSIKGFIYKKGRLAAPGYPIFECNDACECSEECMNRVIQLGRKHSISIMLTKSKGWGVFADERIPRGTYLGIYSGEMILEQEADERGKLYDRYGRTYLFDMDFYFLQGLRGERGATSSPMKKDDSSLSSLYTIDAFHVGNFTRFLNHSCDPNCQIIASYVNEPDLNKPTLTIFTSRDVRQGEELTFAYFGNGSEEEVQEEEEVDKLGQTKVKIVGGPSSHKNKAVHKPCLCGAPNCRGEMF